jgi:OOP family OmpA-OmpF porin
LEALVQHSSITGIGSLLLAAGLGALVASPAAAQPVTDRKDSQDHPLVSRYAGSIILGYEASAFDQVLIPLGPVTADSMGKVIEPPKSQRVEGKVTRIVYLAPEGRSPLEVVRNYEQELKRAGFELIYTCAGDACGPGGGFSLSRMLDRKLPYGNPGPEDWGEYALYGFFKDARFMAARRATSQGNVDVTVFAGRRSQPVPRELADRVPIALSVIESAAMERMVTVDAAEMAREIAESGRVALYDIHFDTNKAELKAESRVALQEIAKLLKQDAALKLLVVGHTDNVGDYAANMALSDRRAAAVISELTTAHGIAGARLRAAGAGMIAPVASNDTEEGRAKNRRVELVKQ